MKIFKLTRKDACDYDEFDSAVVIANDENEAITIPLAGYWDNDDQKYWNKDNLDIVCVGITDSFNEPQLLLASFHAG